ncbi:MAG: HpsJ family protein [Cyanobacteriota bacterium]
MPTSSESSRSGPAALVTAPGLSVVALVLFLLFASTLAAALFPLQPLAPAWQLRLAGTLISGAPFALLGLALLRIAAELGPYDPRLLKRAQLCSQLAVAAALGFLLLVPLQTTAGLQQGRSFNQTQAGRIQRAEIKLKALRQAVASASTNADLNRQLQQLQGPVLGPADIAQPLPLLKAQVGAVLDQGDQQLRRDREASQPTSARQLLPELLRQAFACLLLALGFAALAQRPGSEVSLLQEQQWRWQRTRRSFAGDRGRSSSVTGDYLHELGRQEEDR